MIFNTGAALLDAVVLSVVSREKEGTYGYKITQDVQAVISVSESTLYPVLRIVQLNMYKQEWFDYITKINKLFDGGNQDG